MDQLLIHSGLEERFVQGIGEDYLARREPGSALPSAKARLRFKEHSLPDIADLTLANVSVGEKNEIALMLEARLD